MAPRKASQRKVAATSSAPDLRQTVDQPSFKTRRPRSKRASGRAARVTGDPESQVAALQQLPPVEQSTAASSMQPTADAERVSNVELLRQQNEMADEIKALRGIVVAMVSSVDAIKTSLEKIDSQASSIDVIKTSVGRIDSRVVHTNTQTRELLRTVDSVQRLGVAVHLKMFDQIHAMGDMKARQDQMCDTLDGIGRLQDEMHDTMNETNDTVNDIQETVNEVSIAQDHMNETVNNVEETVNNVEETVNNVEETVNNVEETVNNVEETVNNVEETVNNVEETVNEISTGQGQANEIIDEIHDTVNDTHYNFNLMSGIQDENMGPTM